MNEDQLLVKMHLDPMFTICDFISDLLAGQIKYTQEGAVYKLSPAVQEAKLAALGAAKNKFEAVRQELVQLQQQLLGTKALEHSSLSSVYPTFIETVRSHRNELMQIFTVHSV